MTRLEQLIDAYKNGRDIAILHSDYTLLCAEVVWLRMLAHRIVVEPALDRTLPPDVDTLMEH